jgi:UDP-N-acetylmuramoyl-L-alanyl-D-glutamate--2,6-diaminopimelate ligase
MLGPVELSRIVATLGAAPRVGAGGVRLLGDGGARVAVSDLAYDSRTVRPGSLFFCIRGVRDDGHRYAEAAVRAGAAALVCERPLGSAVPEVVVADARAAMNALASPFWGDPSRELSLVGVTGTNGKTTTAYMLEAILRARGEAAGLTGLIGTVETRVGDESAPGVRTTPESLDLQRLLRRMVDRGVTACAMEVTSIGIVQGRIDGTSFAVGVFTNLTQDHLDFHGTMEAYFEAKRRMFVPGVTALALVNADDPWGVELAHGLPVEVATFGVEAEADLVATGVHSTARGSRFRAVSRPGALGSAGVDLAVETRLPGAFNVSNALAAVGSAAALGVPGEAIAEGLAGLRGVPGRFEPVDHGQPFTVVVDYAHTPDGLVRVLDAARAVTPARGRVLAVFGCGGDRDRAKRPLMGRAAAERSDVVYVTSDNPRSEDPMAIIREILPGIEAAAPQPPVHVVADRAEAIRRSVADARPGDVVVIAGKGHETGQEAGGIVTPFDDRQVASAALRSLATGSDAAAGGGTGT